LQSSLLADVLLEQFFLPEEHLLKPLLQLVGAAIRARRRSPGSGRRLGRRRRRHGVATGEAVAAVACGSGLRVASTSEMGGEVFWLL
jgi:hypothetical protein